MQITIELNDQRVISILASIPEPERGAFIERSILLSHTVVQYAQVTASEVSLQQYFEPPLNKLENAISSLSTLHTTYSNVFAVQSSNIEKLVPALSKSVTRGAINNEIIFQSLCQRFGDDTALDVSGKTQYTDLSFTPDNCKTPILIELKDHSDDVPSKEIKKFWRDMEAQGAKVGVFVSSRTRIQTMRTDFSIESQDGRIGIFIVNSEFGHQGHILAYAMARRLLLALEDRFERSALTKLDFMVKILNSHLKQIEDDIKGFGSLKDELEKIQADFNSRLGNVAGRMEGLQQRALYIVESTLKAFTDELSGLST